MNIPSCDGILYFLLLWANLLYLKSKTTWNLKAEKKKFVIVYFFLIVVVKNTVGTKKHSQVCQSNNQGHSLNISHLTRFTKSFRKKKRLFLATLVFLLFFLQKFLPALHAGKIKGGGIYPVNAPEGYTIDVETKRILYLKRARFFFC